MPEPSERTWIPTAEVQAGDQLAHKLSDTPWTCTRVTGWTDRVLHLGHGMADVTHRIFTVTDAPWWIGTADLTHDLAGRALVMTCGSLPAPEPAVVPVDRNVPAGPAPVTRVIAGDDYYGYRMPVPSAFTYDLMASLDARWAVLESIGIERREDTTPLSAWRDAVADETGVSRATLDPAQGGVLDMGFTPAYVRKFVNFLA